MNKAVSISLRLLTFLTSGVLWYYTCKYILFPKSNKEITIESSEPYKVIRIKIPTYAKGAVIGKNGSNIKRIQDKTKTTIKFVGKYVSEKTVEATDSSWGNTSKEAFVETYDELMIRGLTLRALEAEKEIKNIVSSVPVYTEDVIVIDDKFVGKLIGKKGENIKRLKDTYQVSLDVDRSTNPDRSVTLRGVSANINNCKQDIMKLIENCKNDVYQQQQSSRPVMNSLRPKQNDICPIKEILSDEAIKWNVGEQKKIYVSSVVDCAKFYGQLVGEQIIELETLIEEMTEFYNKQHEYNMKFHVANGDILAGFHENTGTWQRCKVLEVNTMRNGSVPSFVIMYVDYGDSAEVSLSKLRVLQDPRFNLLPFQALMFIRHGLDTHDKVWSESEIENFEKLVHIDQKFVIEVILRNKTDDGFYVSMIGIDEIFPDVITGNQGDAE